MRVRLSPEEAYETVRMFSEQHLDVRTVTLGLSLLRCSESKVDRFCRRIRRLILGTAGEFVGTVRQVSEELGVPVVNCRIAVTPLAVAFGGGREGDYLQIAQTLDQAAAEVGVDFIGGYSALVHKGYQAGAQDLLQSIPSA